MNRDYAKSISALDRSLRTLRYFWITAKTGQEKQKWISLKNQSLDERIRLMQCRDAIAEFEGYIIQAQFTALRVLWGWFRFFRPLWWRLAARKIFST